MSRRRRSGFANPPQIKDRETKSEKRLFRYTPSVKEQLAKLSRRYNTDVSKVFDILVETSHTPEFISLLDKYVSENYS